MLTIKVSVPFRGFRGLQAAWDDASFDFDAGVSVPFRGFRGLQGLHRGGFPGIQAHPVSVPFRGFRGLQASSGYGLKYRMPMFQSPSGVLGVCRRQIGPGGGHRLGVSVPFRGFRGLQERIAKSTRVVWLPYPPRSLHSSCILVHVFPARHPGITPFPPCPQAVFGNSENTPESASSFHRRFRCHSTRSSLLGRSSAHSDSEMSATVTAVFRSSFQTAPGIGPFRGPCRIQAGFHGWKQRLPAITRMS